MLDAWCLENELWDYHSLNRQLLRKISKSQTVLEESEQDCSLQQDGAIVHTVNTTTPFLQDFLHDYTVRCGLWPHNLHISHHPNFCVNLLKKESTAIIQEAKKGECTCLQESWGQFQHLL